MDMNHIWKMICIEMEYEVENDLLICIRLQAVCSQTSYKKTR